MAIVQEAMGQEEELEEGEATAKEIDGEQDVEMKDAEDVSEVKAEKAESVEGGEVDEEEAQPVVSAQPVIFSAVPTDVSKAMKDDQAEKVQENDEGLDETQERRPKKRLRSNSKSEDAQ